jgi:hypothetical protein
MEIEKKSHFFFLLQYLAPLFTSSVNTAKLTSSLPYFLSDCKGEEEWSHSNDSEKNISFFVLILKGIKSRDGIKKQGQN